MNFPKVTFALFAFLVISASAERVARVIYLGATPKDPEKAFVYQAGQTPQEVALARNNFSESIELSSGGVNLIFLPDAVAEEGTVPEGAPALKIAKGWNKVLIFVFKDPKNPVMPIRLKAVNANDDQFGPGELYFMNFTKSTISGPVGEKTLKLKPGAFQIVRDPIKKMGYYRVEIDSLAKGEKEKSWLTRQNWVHQPQVRRVVLALPLPKEKRIKLYSIAIRDF